MPVNDFSILVATVNGTGSQTANLVLLRSIFRMGVPVGPKNVFPSNISGLPTWFFIRVSKDGYVARSGQVDLLVCLNPQTTARDIAALRAGAACFFEERLRDEIPVRDDVTFYPVPFTDLVAACCPVSRLRKLVVNMVYVGVVGWHIGLDRDLVRAEVKKAFAAKPQALDLNLAAVETGWAYAASNLPQSPELRIERLDATRDMIIIDGNSATALGCLFGGCSVLTWYPITPSTSLGDAFESYAERLRVDPESGERTVAIVQSEDELAAAGMAIAAGWAGARAMTATSGPGLSLMSELVGFAYYAEIPCVFVDVQRLGPSTGLPTRTAQGDLLQVVTLSHGDTQHVVLLPATMEECFAFAIRAFDLADRLQTPIFLLLDLDLGMNPWMSAQLEYPADPIDRGKVLTAGDLERLGGDWYRYADPDRDGIPYRTIPGTPHRAAAYFTRGSGHSEAALYTEDPRAYQKVVDRLTRKYETARALLPPPEIDRAPAARILIVAYGSSHPAVVEARDRLRSRNHLECSYCRIRALPLSDRLADLCAAHDVVFVVDQNRDGQMAQLLAIALAPSGCAARLRSIRQYDGWPLTADFVAEAIAGAAGSTTGRSDHLVARNREVEVQA